MERIAIIIAALAGLAVAGLSGFLLIPYLRKLKFGQTIKEIGPTWHKNKQGTPTMGGILFILGSVVGLLVSVPVLLGAEAGGDPMEPGLLVLGVFTALAFGAIGFVDDWLKVARKQNLGLRARAKLVMQSAVAICFLVSLQLMGRLSTLVKLPFFGEVEFGWLFYPLSFLLIVGMTNAVNLTDGVDGLCGSVSTFVMIGYLVILISFGRAYLSAWAAALAGGCLGFVCWNFYPAKVFMGDVGSLFLGGAVAAIGYCMGRPDLVIILGLLYLIEAATVMLQMGFFKLTKRFSKDHQGRRIFKMTPIHHHFEMSGWSEVAIDVTFCLFTILCAVGAYIYAVILG
ncbi:phospho-N-acetylmuramoyl-pentapeptide-transferase [Ruminococcaceae bacterium OttesenSCG-928-D13]|nr:phospho-N-acetylmuramoyl-pentapeptide-transferase [Ruminococcaceae bacterium OttesenSCG-928-D13]